MAIYLVSSIKSHRHNPMANEHFAVLSITYTPIKHGYIITATTDVPCHLWMRWSLALPRKHPKTIIVRGEPFMKEVYLCFDVYTDNEQDEAGDTLTHTYVKENWPYCQTRYFYFLGTIATILSPSETALFTKHRDHIDLQIRIAIPTDDCQRGTFDGAPYFGTDYGYIAAGWYDIHYTLLGGGMRFQNVNLPPEAIIIQSYLRFRRYILGQFLGCRTKIRGHRVPNSPTFSSMVDFDTRARTIETVFWDNIEDWIIVQDYNSPSITPIIEELRNLAGWTPGNPMTLFWDDYDDRSTHLGFRARWAQSYNSIPALAPLLVMLYRLPIPP